MTTTQIADPNLEAEVVGHKEDDCGVEVFDERGNRHVITIGWDGDIQRHSQESYPHAREDRTQEQQRIMSQVEARARFAAQQAFPEEDILTPMWDPDHVQRGIEALMNYQLEEFHDQFRDFYEALDAPWEMIDDSEYVHDDSEVAYKPFRIDEENRVTEVLPVHLRYKTQSGEERGVGPRPPTHSRDLIHCKMPYLEFEDHITFEDHFHEIVVGHLMAQIRDIYLNMGEQAPEEYKVEGIGKLDIHGDGVGDS